jgi:sugar phosphate isomerase/epimerase
MKNLSRRQFLGTTALGLGSAFLAGRNALAATGDAAIKKPDLGFQIWTVREMLLKDFPGTLKMIAGMGYKTVEMCSPPGYGFKPLMQMTAKEMKKIINDAGLKFESTHYGFREFRENLDERIAFAKESGQKQMILSSFGLPKTATLDDWRKAADELNKHGEKTKKAGIQMGFHNHHGEFEKLDGKLIYDVLMETFDPDLVKMQFQVAVINIGFKAADYFKKYPGRFISAHLADYSETEKKTVALGKGIVDWNEFFSSLKTGGVKNIFVEMDLDTFKDSAQFISTL